MVKLQRLFGGSIKRDCRSTGWFYTWQVQSRKALAFLEVVYPYLVVKGEQAEVAIRFGKRRLPKGQNVGRDVAADLADDQELRRLKRVIHDAPYEEWRKVGEGNLVA